MYATSTCRKREGRKEERTTCFLSRDIGYVDANLHTRSVSCQETLYPRSVRRKNEKRKQDIKQEMKKDIIINKCCSLSRDTAYNEHT